MIFNKLIFIHKEPPINYLTFESNATDNFNLYVTSPRWDGILEYSLNTEDWNIWDGTLIQSSLNNGKHRIYLRGTGNTIITGYSFSTAHENIFRMSGRASSVYCLGNIEMLLDYQLSSLGAHPSMSSYAFSYMFYTCEKLVSPPELPSTVLSDHCYYNMFTSCSNLLSAPVLPATTLAASCYGYMFDMCSSLLYPPSLPAINIASGCYYGMFERCSSLRTPVDLPATTLYYACYNGMFMNCYNLLYAPSLPATSIVENCYQNMFYGCRSITKIPLLRSTSLPKECYRAMFYGCNNIKIASYQTGDCTYGFRIPENGTAVEGTDSLKNMFKNTTGIFEGTEGTPITDYTYYLNIEPV